LPKGGIPLFGKEGVGEILEEYVKSIMDLLIQTQYIKRHCEEPSDEAIP
jgi:hypothetical protein